MADIVNVDFESDVIGDEPVGFTTFYQSASQGWAVRTDMPGNATQSLKSEAGLWNQIDNDTAPGIADYALEIEASLTSGARLSLNVRVVGHAATSARFPTNGYGGDFRGFDNLLRILRFNPNNSVTVLTTKALTIDTSTHTLRIEIDGSVIKVFFDGNEELSFTDSTYTADGLAGLSTLKSGGDVWIDPFKIQTLTTDNPAAFDSHGRRGRR